MVANCGRPPESARVAVTTPESTMALAGAVRRSSAGVPFRNGAGALSVSSPFTIWVA